MKVYWERKGDEKTGSPKIVYDGIPFVYMGEKILWCHQGKDKYMKAKILKMGKSAPVRRNVGKF